MDKLKSYGKTAASYGKESSASLSNRFEQRNSASNSGYSASNSGNSSPIPPSSSYSTPPAPRSSGAGASSGVFVGISSQEKEAFFNLLDEYFESRPQFKAFATQNSFSTPAANPVSSPAYTPTPKSVYSPSTPPFNRSTPPIAPPSRVPAVQKRGLGEAEALYDLDAVESEDLTLKVGDKILILEKVSEDWWKGEIVGDSSRSGLFPATYVKML